MTPPTSASENFESILTFTQGFLPTVILVVLTPTFSTVLMGAANKLTDMENYDTVDGTYASGMLGDDKPTLTNVVGHDSALVQKHFVLNFMTSYMALLFTAFVYIPFGHALVPLLNFWKHTAQVLTFSDKPLPTQQFQIKPERISAQMFYFTVTAQIVNFATEVIVPYVKHKAFAKAKELQSKKAPNQDHDEEVEFLKRVRDECELEAYDVTADYREMVMQFGKSHLRSDPGNIPHLTPCRLPCSLFGRLATGWMLLFGQ